MGNPFTTPSDIPQLATTKVRPYSLRNEARAEYDIDRWAHTDYQLAESCKLQLDYTDEQSDFRDTDFPARYIYERLLPSVVGRLTDIYYHRSSPYSGFGKVTTDKNYGDLHQCERNLAHAISKV